MNARSDIKDIDLFFDDFTGAELDHSKWNVAVTGDVYNNEQQAYVDSPKTIYLERGDETADGVLIIHPRYQHGYVTLEGKVFDLLSGRLHTRKKFEFIYGTVSARMRMPSAVGLWPAFWMLGAVGPWPQCGEIDIMENVGEADWASVALHGPGYFGETPLVNKKYFTPPDNATQWHVFSMHWSPDGFVFEIDSELIYRVTRPMVEFYGKWVFDGPHYLIINLALGGTYPFKTNRIGSPYYGIPENTIRAIQNNEVKLMVDWVRVTQV